MIRARARNYEDVMAVAAGLEHFTAETVVQHYSPIAQPRQSRLGIRSYTSHEVAFLLRRLRAVGILAKVGTNEGRTVYEVAG